MKARVLLAGLWSGLHLSLAFGQGVEVCTPEQVKEWTKLRVESLGVQLRDPSPNLMPGALPPAPGESPDSTCPGVVHFAVDQDGHVDDGIHQWVYALSCKQTVCGQPLSFESNKGASFLSGEFDLNNNLKVPVDLEKRLSRYRCFQEAGNGVLRAPQYPHLCFPQIETIHTEISPPPGMRKALGNLWFQSYPERWLAWRARLGEGKVCMQGPVVGDTGHAAKLEVHPAQFIWWNENKDRETVEANPFQADGPFLLLAIQDASARYSRKHHFVLHNPVPPKGTWRPWAAGPIEASYEIPVWAKEDETIHLLIQNERLDRHSRPADPPPPAVLSYKEALDARGGRPFRAIVSNAADARAVQAEMRVFCRTEGNSDPKRDAGYLAKLVLSVTVGSDVDWQEGFLALRVTDRRTPELPRLEERDGVAPKPVVPEVLSLVTWEPTRKTGWQGVPAVSPEDARTADKITNQLFEAAGWTSQENPPLHPYPGLRRLREIDVKIQHSLHGPEEKEARGMKSTVTWEELRLDPLPGASCGRPKPPTKIKSGLRILFDEADGALDVCELKVTVMVQPSEAFKDWAQRKGLQPPRETASTWSVWTHGFVAGREDQWASAVNDLWTKEVTKEVKACGNGGKLDTSLPKEEVQILLPAMLKDGVVTVHEVANLATDLRALAKVRCDKAPAPRRPSPWIQAN